jgi:hypothetical protein
MHSATGRCNIILSSILTELFPSPSLCASALELMILVRVKVVRIILEEGKDCQMSTHPLLRGGEAVAPNRGMRQGSVPFASRRQGLQRQPPWQYLQNCSHLGRSERTDKRAGWCRSKTVWHHKTFRRNAPSCSRWTRVQTIDVCYACVLFTSFGLTATKNSSHPETAFAEYGIQF